MRSAVLLVTGLVLALLINDKLPFPEVPRITKEQLKELLGKPDLVIIDARPMEQWKYSDQMIPGTVYEDPLAIQSWAHKYDKNRKIVVY